MGLPLKFQLWGKEENLSILTKVLNEEYLKIHDLFQKEKTRIFSARANQTGTGQEKRGSRRAPSNKVAPRNRPYPRFDGGRLETAYGKKTHGEEEVAGFSCPINSTARDL